MGLALDAAMLPAGSGRRSQTHFVAVIQPARGHAHGTGHKSKQQFLTGSNVHSEVVGFVWDKGRVAFATDQPLCGAQVSAHFADLP
jgi:hypothetical protein